MREIQKSQLDTVKVTGNAENKLYWSKSGSIFKSMNSLRPENNYPYVFYYEKSFGNSLDLLWWPEMLETLAVSPIFQIFLTEIGIIENSWEASRSKPALWG